MKLIGLPRMPWTAQMALAGLTMLLLAGLLAPVLAPYRLDEVVGDVWQSASDRFVLGTDNLGRDLLSRVLYALRLTLFIAGAATALSFAIGTFLGFLAASLRGWLDQLISRANDLLMSVPTLILALVVLSVLPRSVFVLILVMAVLDATRVFRLARAIALDISVTDFVEAAKLRGERFGWIMFREVLPNALTHLVAEFGLRFAFAILFLSSLSFLGFGIQPPASDLGRMVRENKDGIVYGISAAIAPAAVIALLAILANLVVDGVLNRTTRVRGGDVDV